MKMKVNSLQLHTLINKQFYSISRHFEAVHADIADLRFLAKCVQLIRYTH